MCNNSRQRRNHRNIRGRAFLSITTSLSMIMSLTPSYSFALTTQTDARTAVVNDVSSNGSNDNDSSNDINTTFQEQSQKGYHLVITDDGTEHFVPNEYTLRFISEGLQDDIELKHVYDEKSFTLPDAGENSTKPFLGWSTTRDNKDVEDDLKTTEDETCKAILVPANATVEKDLTVKYLVMDNVDNTKTHEETACLLDWEIDGDIVLYAQWGDVPNESVQTPSVSNNEDQASQDKGSAQGQPASVTDEGGFSASVSQQNENNSKTESDVDVPGTPVPLENTSDPLFMTGKTMMSSSGDLGRVRSRGTGEGSDETNTITNLKVKWLPEGTTDTLELLPETQGKEVFVPDHKWQIDFKLNSKGSYEVGDIEIDIPAAIWHARETNVPLMILDDDGLSPVKLGDAGSERADLVWQRVADSIVITNNKRLNGSSAIMMQGHFGGGNAADIVDMQDSAPFNAHVRVTRPDGITIEATSNSIFAKVNTSHNIDRGHKYATSYNTTGPKESERVRDEMPEEFLPEHPDDYLYLKWYLAETASGSQPMDVMAKDTLTDEYGGIILGAERSVDKRRFKPETPTNEFSFPLFSGYSIHSQGAYVWVAYPLSSFVVEGRPYAVSNKVEFNGTGYDDGEVSTLSLNSSKAYLEIPKRYRVHKEWGDEDSELYRPESTTVYVFSALATNPTAISLYKELQLNAENNWTAEWEEESRTNIYQVSEFPGALEYSSVGMKEDTSAVESQPRVYMTPKLDSATGQYYGYRFEQTSYDAETRSFTIQDRLYVKTPEKHKVELRFFGGDYPEISEAWVGKDLRTPDIRGVLGSIHKQVGPLYEQGSPINTYRHANGYVEMGLWQTVSLTTDGSGKYFGEFTDDDPFPHTYVVHEKGDCVDGKGTTIIEGEASQPSTTYIREEDHARVHVNYVPWRYNQTDRFIETENMTDGFLDSYVVENTYYMRHGKAQVL